MASGICDINNSVSTIIGFLDMRFSSNCNSYNYCPMFSKIYTLDDNLLQ